MELHQWLYLMALFVIERWLLYRELLSNYTTKTLYKMGAYYIITFLHMDLYCMPWNTVYFVVQNEQQLWG